MSLEYDNAIMKEQFFEIVQGDDKTALKEFLDDQNISDVAHLVDEYPEYEHQIIDNLSIHRAASTFKILDLPTQKRVMRDLPPSKIAELLNEMSPDDRTDFLEGLPSSIVRELIKLLNPEERKVTLSLFGYPENSVGRLMTPDYIYVSENDTIAQVMDNIRRNGKNSETIDVIYVINEKGELIDDIRIREFILNTPDKKVSDIMDRRMISLNAYQDQEEAYKAFKMNNRVALPVVSNSNKLLGIVTVDDVLWVATEEFSEDIQKIGGAEALDEPYLEIGFVKLIKKRVGWLIILFLSEMLTTTAMQYFNVELGKALVLGIFIPLTISAGGNSGSQASTLIIRAMALGEITLRDWWRILRREILSGLTLGIILGCVGFLRVGLWQVLHIYNYGQYYILIATTIMCSLIGIVLWGSVIGSMLPIVLKKFKLDPATSSAPFVATLVDVTGIVIYFSMAYLLLNGTVIK
ncbi:MAG TPA: magnesium transporter [Puia sp.]|jgi:magnesium transporter|nr:magnesium transporter [Puia sp.]